MGCGLKIISDRNAGQLAKNLRLHLTYSTQETPAFSSRFAYMVDLPNGQGTKALRRSLSGRH